MDVVEREVTIVNSQGLHARPSAEFVKTAARFASEIFVRRELTSVNGKSILGVMTLAAECGTVLIIRAEGEDAAFAIDALALLVSNGFQE